MTKMYYIVHIFFNNSKCLSKRFIFKIHRHSLYPVEKEYNPGV